jgi:hypothetical protein
MGLRAVSWLVAVLLASVILVAPQGALSAQAPGAPLKAKIRFESTPPAAVVTVLRGDRVVISARTPAAFVLTWEVDQPLQIVFALRGHEECRRQMVVRRASRVEGVLVLQDSLEQRFRLGRMGHQDAPMVECTLRRLGGDDG